MTDSSEPSLYERIGGSEAIEAAIDAFYVRVLDDDRVNHYFDGMDVDRIKRQQRRFFEVGTGGPGEYDVELIEKTHKRHNIDEEAYDTFMGHFEDTLEAFGVPAREQEEIMAATHAFREDVLAVE